MPRFTKKYNRRKRRVSKRTKGKRITRRRANAMPVEYKSIDYDLQSTPVNYARVVDPPTYLGGLFPLNGIQSGSGINQRVGRRCNFSSIYIRGSTYQSVTAPTPTSAFAPRGCRIIVFVDKQANATVPTVTELLQGTRYDSVATTTWSTALNLSNAQRFHVIMDKQFVLQSTGPTWLQGGSVSHKIYKRINVSTQYNAGTTGTYTDIQTGAIWIMLLCDPTAVTGQLPPAFEGTIRLRYVD